MGRAICLWLVGCLALASAIPLPEPTSEQDILNKILNAKPEDNDIDPIPKVTEAPGENLKEQELPKPEPLQDITEESKAQEAPDNEKEKPESENLQKTSDVLPLDHEDQPDEFLPVTAEEQTLTELDTLGGAQPFEDQLFTEEDAAEAEPQPDEEDETPIILIAKDEILPLDPEEAPIIIVQEAPSTPDEGDPSEADLPFYHNEEEQLFPVNDEEEDFPINIDEDQIIVVSEDNSGFDLNAGNGEMSVPVTVLQLEKDEFGQPILSEPFVPEPQVNEGIPTFAVGENSPFSEESDGLLHFDMINIPEPVQNENSQTANDGSALREVPIQEIPAFMSNVGLPIVPENEESVSHLFADPIFRASPPVYPSEDDYQSRDDVLGVYYIPEGNFPVEDDRYENQPETVPEEEVQSNDEFSTEPGLLTTDDEFIAHLLEASIDETANPEEQNPLLEDDVSNTSGLDLNTDYPLMEEMPTNFGEDQMPVIPAGEPELEKIGTVIVLEAPESPVDTLEPSLIHMDGSPINQHPLSMDLPVMTGVMDANPFNSIIPESLITPDSQPMIANEPIVPLAEFPEGGVLPVNYWIPNNEEQQAIIFPEELSPRHNLPVFPENWNEGGVPLPTTNEALYPNIPSQYGEAPSYNTFSDAPSSHGPSPPQQPTEEQFKSVYNPANDEMPTQNVDFMTSPEIPQMPREEDFTIYENNDNMFEPSGHIHIPDGFPQTFEYPNFRTRFNRPASFGLPSMFDMTYQQDYHGPNTFPLNFRRSDFSSQMTNTYYNPYNDRTSSFNNADGNIFSDSSIIPQDFRQSSNLGNIPKAFPNTQNMFFSMLNEPVKIMQDNNDQNMNLRNFQSPATFMGPDRFNQQEQPYDIQVAIVPFESSFNIPSYAQNRQQEMSYPYAQQSNAYDTYQGFSYNIPAYGGSNLFSRSGIFSSPIRSTYDMSFNYGNQNANDRRFNYPVPTW